jgi:hypothetical protein
MGAHTPRTVPRIAVDMKKKTGKSSFRAAKKGAKKPSSIKQSFKQMKPFAPPAAWVQQIYTFQRKGDQFKGLTKVAATGYSKTY